MTVQKVQFRVPIKPGLRTLNRHRPDANTALVRIVETIPADHLVCLGRLADPERITALCRRSGRRCRQNVFVAAGCLIRPERYTRFERRYRQLHRQKLRRYRHYRRPLTVKLRDLAVQQCHRPGLDCHQTVDDALYIKPADQTYARTQCSHYLSLAVAATALFDTDPVVVKTPTSASRRLLA